MKRIFEGTNPHPLRCGDSSAGQSAGTDACPLGASLKITSHEGKLILEVILRCAKMLVKLLEGLKKD